MPGILSPSHLLLILLLAVLVFGTRKLRNAGGDLGAAVKNFKSAMKDGEDEARRNTDDIILPPKSAEQKARESAHDEKV